MSRESDDELLLAEVRAQTAGLTLPRFDHEDARRIGVAAIRLAEESRLPVVIGIRRGEQRVFHAAFAGTTAEHDDWVRRKTNTVLRHEVSSLEFLLRHSIAGQAPSWLDPVEYAVAGGAVPIFVGTALAGVIAVSGLVGSIREDHDLAIEALRAGATASAR